MLLQELVTQFCSRAMVPQWPLETSLVVSVVFQLWAQASLTQVLLQGASIPFGSGAMVQLWLVEKIMQVSVTFRLWNQV
jgi:hypothetical protein